MVKTSNKIGEPFEVVVKGVKMLIVARKMENVNVSPCESCDLREVKTVKGGTTPRNCHRIVPSCFAHQRKDNNSVIYKQIKY